MRILMLAHRIPYPPHTGDKTRAFHIARHLAKHHDVTLAFLVDEPADLTGLTPLQAEVPGIEFAQVWKPWGLIKGVLGLATGRSLSLPYFRSGALARKLERRAAGMRFDAVYASSTPMAQYARAFGGPLIMDFVDVDSDKWTQYAAHSRWPLSGLYRTEGRRLQAAEAAIARSASRCLLATSAEEALLKSFAPWARTTVIPNGIDLEHFRPIEEQPASPGLIFTGAMDYLPNIDAVTYFCREVLPRVRATVSGVPFYIVGLNPSREVQRLAEIPGVVVTGTVPDVRPYYAGAAVCVAPIRIGRGVQNKVLQAMAMGVPVVASSIAQRGLEAKAGEHLYVEDEPERFAALVSRLLQSSGARQAMSRSARAFVETHHAWSSSLAGVDEVVRGVAASDRTSIGAAA